MCTLLEHTVYTLRAHSRKCSRAFTAFAGVACAAVSVTCKRQDSHVHVHVIFQSYMLSSICSAMTCWRGWCLNYKFSGHIPGREFCAQEARRRCSRRTRCRWSWCSAWRRGGSRGRGSTGWPPPGSLAGWGPPLPPWNRRPLFSEYCHAIVIIIRYFPNIFQNTPPSSPPALKVWATENVWKPYNSLNE